MEARTGSCILRQDKQGYQNRLDRMRSNWYPDGSDRIRESFMEDERIIELYWRRDEDAVRQTNQKYGPYCYRIAHNILKNEEDSKECVNDTWFKAWTVIPPQRPDFFQAFLGRITRNLSLDRYRRTRASKRGGGSMDVIYEELAECIADAGTEESRTDTIVITDAVTQFLTGLSKDARIIFVRRYWYADSVSQIAQHYGMSESKVKSSLMRSRNKLKAFLEKEGIAV